MSSTASTESNDNEFGVNRTIGPAKVRIHSKASASRRGWCESRLAIVHMKSEHPFMPIAFSRMIPIREY